MSDTLRKVDYFYVMVPNTAGQGSNIMSGLAAEGGVRGPGRGRAGGLRAGHEPPLSLNSAGCDRLNVELT